MKLEDAIRDQYISVEEIVAFAAIDAKNGFCTESTETQNGLTLFSYSYPQYTLRTIHDVYETPDGQAHLINTLELSSPSVHHGFPSFLADDTDPYVYIDREDWGLSFSVAECDSTGVKLQSSQAGGQQLGDLFVTEYRIYAQSTDSLLFPDSDCFDNLPIAMDSTGELFISWGELSPHLVAGNYVLHITVTDQYDPSQVHPLMKNFYDSQRYYIPFTIQR